MDERMKQMGAEQKEMIQVSGADMVPEAAGTESTASASWPYAEHAVLLRTWLGRLFWVFIALFAMNFVVGQIKAPEILSAVVSLARGVAVGYILLQLAPVHKGYRMAGCVSIILSVVDAATSMLTDNVKILVPLLVLALAASFVQMYFEYTAHAAVLAGLDGEFSGKWRRLWKWTIGLLTGLIGCILLVLLEPLSAMALVLVVALALVVTAILYVVYLHRMAQMFRSIAEKEAQADEVVL